MAQWTFDPVHTNIDFSVRHMMVTNVRGTFGKFDGTLAFDPENPGASSVEVAIDAASINTGANDRDNHLRSADFFEAARFPQITFKSTHIAMQGADRAGITGDLTIRDVTKPVTLDATFLGQITSPYGDQRAGFEASAKINREEFGLTWNQALEAGGVLVGKDITIHLAVEVVMVQEAALA